LQNRQVLNVRANHRGPCVRRGGQQPEECLAAGVALSRLSLGVAPGARLSKIPSQRPRAPAVRIPFPAMLESRPTSDRAQVSAGDSIASTFRLLWHGARPLEVPAHIGLVPLPVSAGATRTVVSVALA